MKRLPLASCVLLCVFSLPALSQDAPELVRQRRAFLGAAGKSQQERAAALREMKHASAGCIEFLEEVRKTDADPSIRLLALRQMGVVGADPAKKYIKRVLRRAAGQERAIALWAWSDLRPLVPAKRFLEVLSDEGETPGAVHVSAKALAHYPTVDAAKALAGTIETAADVTRRAAREALREIVGAAPVGAWFAEEALKKRKPPYPDAIEDLLRVASACRHPAITPAVRRRLRGGPPRQRALAALALGALEAGRGAKSQASLNALTPLLRDRRPEVASAAGLAIGAIGPHGAALEALVELAKTGRAGLRAMALGALAGVEREGLVDIAAKGLAHKTAAVRFAAVECLAGRRTKESVRALVDGLKGTDGRLEAQIARALGGVTGADMGGTYADWAPWWDAVEDEFELPDPDAKPDPKARGAAGNPNRKTAARPKYYGVEIVSNRVAFLIDTSGSMKDPMRLDTSTVELTRLAVCQVELRGVVRDLDRRTQFNLVAFANRFKGCWKRLTSARKKKKKDEARAFILALDAAGGTNIFDPLAATLADPNVDTIWLLSDGDPTAGKFLYTEELLREVRLLNATLHVAIHTISIGQESELLKRLAAENGGTYHVR